MDTVDFVIDFDDKQATFRLQPLKRKTAMMVSHKFIGEIQKANGNITLVDFDILDGISEELFKRAFIEIDGEAKELKDISDFFADKIDIWYQAIGEGIRANCPDLFTRLEKAAK
jgi:hypothetical protein